MLQIRIDMPMPRCCADCKFCIGCEKCVIKDIRFGSQDNWIDSRRPNWCQLVEAEEIVHCSDCTHSKRATVPGREIWCERINRHTAQDWFCADGIRRESE